MFLCRWRSRCQEATINGGLHSVLLATSTPAGSMGQSRFAIPNSRESKEAVRDVIAIHHNKEVISNLSPKQDPLRIALDGSCTFVSEHTPRRPAAYRARRVLHFVGEHHSPKDPQGLRIVVRTTEDHSASGRRCAVWPGSYRVGFLTRGAVAPGQTGRCPTLEAQQRWGHFHYHQRLLCCDLGLATFPACRAHRCPPRPRPRC